jgi:hypothetical protein
MPEAWMASDPEIEGGIAVAVWLIGIVWLLARAREAGHVFETYMTNAPRQSGRKPLSAGHTWCDGWHASHREEAT